MKALTLYQPWATLVMLGCKRFETRSWNTGHRGQIAIHSSKRWDPDLGPDVCLKDPFHPLLLAARIFDLDELPRGMVLGTVDLVATMATTYAAAVRLPDNAMELGLGNYAPGRFAWELQNPIPFRPPMAARGQLGLWEWTVPPPAPATEAV